MARAQSPIKVHESTKQKVRYAALMAGLQQAELVEIAVDEYIERHREELGERMERAREAVLGGKASALAYATGVSEEDIERVGGGRVRSVRFTQAEPGDLEPGEFAGRPFRSWLPELGPGRVEDEPEEHVTQALVDEATIYGLSRDRDPDLVTCRVGMLVSVDVARAAGRPVNPTVVADTVASSASRDHAFERLLGATACFPPSVALHVFPSRGFGLERNRPPPRLRVFPWRPAWALGGRGVRRFAPDPASSTRQVNLDGTAQAGTLVALGGAAAN